MKGFLSGILQGRTVERLEANESLHVWVRSTLLQEHLKVIREEGRGERPVWST